KECKILFLGSGDSGKSMIVKRMKIHRRGFDARELTEYHTMIKRVRPTSGTARYHQVNNSYSALL
ncbi:hypothetical protein C8J57DRAFT_1069563, partial [Mycena rebaudengoi]